MKFKKFATSEKTKRDRHTRISPFLLLEVFIIFFWIPYLLISGGGRLVQFILVAVLIVYTAFADFVIWRLFEGKKKWPIWIIESVISTLLIFWIT